MVVQKIASAQFGLFDAIVRNLKRCKQHELLQIHTKPPR
jgi:hypothetical protein